MITGSCLCGQVRYELAGAIYLINNCHCSQCRKAHGAAYGSFLHANTTGFKWRSGEHLVKTYKAREQDDRCFCKHCGSSLPVIEQDENNVIIPAGTLDTDPGEKPSINIFAGSKAAWFDITDTLPKFDEFPPDDVIQELLKEKIPE